jgi:hypothetical protein
MAFTWKEKLILLKAETTYGTDAAPSGTANAIKTLNGSITPVEGNEETLDVDNPTLGAPVQQLSGTHVSVKFDFALCGSGTAGTAPSWGAVMLCSGWSQTVTASTDVKYKPINSLHGSATLYFQMKGALHKLVGVRGKITLNASAGKWLLASFDGKGLFVPVTTAAATLPAATYAAANELLVNDANSDFSVDGFVGKLQELTFDSGNEVVGRFLVGEESIQSRDPVPVGNLNFEDPGVAVKDFFALAMSKPPTLVAVTLTHGTVAGNIVDLTGAKVQLGPKVNYADVDGYRHLTMATRYTADTAGPVTLTVK